jgi:SAM-dependent methyltransferase
MSEAKYAEEKRFWKDEIKRYVNWYNGRCREMYGVPRPSSHERIVSMESIELNAIETWIIHDKWRYCKHLFVSPSYFSGLSVLEVGCGPLGLSRFFAGARVTGLDPLHDWYKDCGYQIDRNGIENVSAVSEEMPFDSDSFDAIVSVNAIDHVDDFEKSISECERVCKQDGEIRIEIHYHEATVTEPVVLNDERVSAAFRKFNMRKIAENKSSLFYPRGTHPDTDRFALWSNSTSLFNAVEVLR